jgi:hypothetical protein
MEPFREGYLGGGGGGGGGSRCTNVLRRRLVTPGASLFIGVDSTESDQADHQSLVTNTRSSTSRTDESQQTYRYSTSTGTRSSRNVKRAGRQLRAGGYISHTQDVASPRVPSLPDM